MQNTTQICSCLICRKEYHTSALTSHIRTHSRTIHNCINCNKETFNVKFCSLSCSATFNNLHQILTQYTRDKISKTLLTNQHLYKKPIKVKIEKYPYTKIWFKICIDCNTNYVSIGPKSKFCELCRNSRKTKNGIRTNRTTYNGVILDSSWELRIAKKLDELQIRWCRPKPIYWFDNCNIQHKYFSDFYLSDYNLYIDPKNPYRILRDKEKLEYFNGKINLIYGNVNKIIDYLVGLSGVKLKTGASQTPMIFISL